MSKATLTGFQIHLETYEDTLEVVLSFKELKVQGPVAFDILYVPYYFAHRHIGFAQRLQDSIANRFSDDGYDSRNLPSHDQ